MPPRKKASTTQRAAPTKKTAAKRTVTEKTAAKQAPAASDVPDEVTAEATPADNDLEMMLAEYERLKSEYAEPAEHKARREELRDKIAGMLAADGPRLFVDGDGHKAYAWQTTPETVDLDVEELIRMDEAGEIPYDLLDKVAPRQLHRSGLRSAIETGALTAEQVATVATVRSQTPRIYTRSVDDGDEG